MGKRYTLEVSAQELIDWDRVDHVGCDSALGIRLENLLDKVKADRHQDDLRLPWRAVRGEDGKWYVRGQQMGFCCVCSASETIAKRMAAANELLEAVKAAEMAMRGVDRGRLSEGEVGLTMSLIARALRKVETGEVEP